MRNKHKTYRNNNHTEIKILIVSKTEKIFVGIYPKKIRLTNKNKIKKISAKLAARDSLLGIIKKSYRNFNHAPPESKIISLMSKNQTAIFCQQFAATIIKSAYNVLMIKHLSARGSKSCPSYSAD